MAQPWTIQVGSREERLDETRYGVATYPAPMDGPSPTPRVLVIGLDPHRVPGPWDPEPVAAGIEAGRARFVEHGVGAEFCLVGLDGSDDIEVVVSAALSSRPWECVVVGGGLRDDPELLEVVVNLVRHHAAAAAIAFNDSPEGTFDAAARWLGTSG